MPQSCRDVSTILPGDVVARDAAVVSHGLRTALAEKRASMGIWTGDAELSSTQELLFGEARLAQLAPKFPEDAIKFG